MFVDRDDPIYLRLKEAWDKNAELVRGNSEWNSWHLICASDNDLCKGDLAQYFMFNLSADPQGKFDMGTRIVNDDGSTSQSGIYLGAGAAGIPFIRNLMKPESMVGATPEEVRALLPDDWDTRSVKKGVGIRWLSAKDGRYGQVRFMSQGSPQVADPLHQEPYIHVSIGGLEYRVAAAGSSVIENPAVPNVQVEKAGPMGPLGPRSPGEPAAAEGGGE